MSLRRRDKGISQSDTVRATTIINLELETFLN